MKKISGLLFILLFIACTNPSKQSSTENKNVPVIGFLDAFQDETIAQARKGFYEALKQQGFNEDSGTIRIIYRNAQGDIPTLTQAVDYFISQNVKLIATCPTLSTITAVQKTKTIPVCQMVAPSPEMAKLTDANGNPPSNLFGVYETLAYIDTSVTLIKKILPDTKTIGVIFNQAEPQSQLALKEIKGTCDLLSLNLIALPVNNSSETQLVINSLINKKIDAFFAMPDNTIFASFETIVKSCNDAHVPIFTSEAGLVKRGALAAYGADLYQWGFQAGQEAAQYLKQGNMNGLKLELVKVRKRMYNPGVAEQFSIQFDSSYHALENPL